MKKALTIITVLFCSLTIAQATRLEEVTSTGEENNYTKPIQRLRLTGEGADPVCAWKIDGLSDPEQTIRWSGKKKVEFQIPLEGGVRSVVFENVIALGAQVAEVFVNDRFLKEYHFTQKMPQQSIHVEFTEFMPSIACVKLILPDACIPNNGDPRTLSLAFRTIALYDVPDPVFKGCHNVGYSFFPVAGVQRFKESLVALEEALQKYADAHACQLTDIWDDHCEIWIRLHNSATTAYQIALFVENLTRDWKPGDPHASDPVAIGRENWKKFVAFGEAERLLACARGRLKEDLLQGDQQWEESFMKQMMYITFQELAAGEGETKQIAIEILKRVPDFARIERKRFAKEALTADEAESERISKQYFDRMIELKVKPPSSEEIIEKMLLEKRPVYTELLRVMFLAVSFSQYKFTF